MNTLEQRIELVAKKYGIDLTACAAPNGHVSTTPSVLDWPAEMIREIEQFAESYAGDGAYMWAEK